MKKCAIKYEKEINKQKEKYENINDEDIVNDDVNKTIIPKKKKSIPKIIKNLVWDTYIGEQYGIGKCYVCERKINAKDFECGHIIAESKGGDAIVENLRPVCRCCNGSVGSMNMDEFKKIYFKN
jgi:5-methylcytosine-specific restriction endonuclease McrA